MTRYEQGRRLESEHCKRAVEEGAFLALRGAGSRCYGKYKVDTVDINKERIRLIQWKKKGAIKKKDLVGLVKLQQILTEPLRVEICLGTNEKIENVSGCIHLIFE